ncbi:DNA repair protein RAD57 [Spathaspora sp. JA1]|nr:DNA repair protein RAD57 [Spathaspora sp. JA1]
MDDCKQLGPNDYNSSITFPILTSIFSEQGKSITDLLHSQDTHTHTDVSRLVDRPIREIDDYYKCLENDLLPKPANISLYDSMISTGLPSIDKELGGGIPIGELVEVFGASGCGKSHFLYQLLLQCQGSFPDSSSIHIATESFLETKRIEEFSNGFRKSGNPADMANISYIYCHDLVSQDHILYTQLPIKLAQENGKTKLVIIDSIAQHFRREDCISNSLYFKQKLENQEREIGHDRDYQEIKVEQTGQLKKLQKAHKYAVRSTKTQYLCQLYQHLSRLAKQFNVAVVFVNQVSDHTLDPLKNIQDAYGEDFASPLNLDFQTVIAAGWDKKLVYNYLPPNTVMLDQRELEALDYELLTSMESNNPKKRQKLSNLDSRNSTNNEGSRDNLDDQIQYKRDLILKSHTLRSGATKRIVPTLGYTWSKRIGTRIMLMKSYKPIVKDEGDVQDNSSHTKSDLPFRPLNEDSNTNGKRNSSEGISQESADTSLIKGWQAQRFIKVVSSTHNPGANGLQKYPFYIADDGLIEI